jgi:exopolysaccharide production protein ExoZ
MGCPATGKTQTSLQGVLAKWCRFFESSGGTSRITPLEGMRGYAVLLVFLVHQHTLFSEHLTPGSALRTLSQFGHHIGNSGVDLFFVLSGFLIYGHVLRRSPPYASFLRKRIGRIYPTFICVFLVYVLLSHLFPAFSKMPQAPAQEVVYLIENVLLLPGIFAINPLVTVSWSLSFEFFFYLSIPLLVSGLRLQSWKRSSRVMLFLVMLTVHSVGYYRGLLPHIRLTTFMAGILLYEAYESGSLTKKLSRLGEIAVIILYACIFLSPRSPENISVYWSVLLGGSLFGLTVYTIGFNGILRTAFNWTPLRWVGNISYSFFLLHGLVLYGVAFLLVRLGISEHFTAFTYGVLVLFDLVVALLASSILFVLVEKPFSLDMPARRSGEVKSRTAVVSVNFAEQAPEAE